MYGPQCLSRSRAVWPRSSKLFAAKYRAPLPPGVAVDDKWNPDSSKMALESPSANVFDKSRKAGRPARGAYAAISTSGAILTAASTTLLIAKLPSSSSNAPMVPLTASRPSAFAFWYLAHQLKMVSLPCLATPATFNICSPAIYLAPC